MPFHIALITGVLIGGFNYLSVLFLKKLKNNPEHEEQLSFQLMKYAGIPPLGLVIVLFLLGLGFILGLKEYLEMVLSNK